MKKIIHLSTFLMAVCISFMPSAAKAAARTGTTGTLRSAASIQQQAITGTIVDEQGQPVIG
ncbi:MAG: hypothetical protein LKG82_00540, partial [Prevotella sp.]|nr:hypothetical protein [Prevotella sp.]